MLVKFQDSAKLKARADRDHLIKVLADNANGMILWAKLMMNELELGRWNVQAVLQKPPRGLSTVYDSIISRILSDIVAVDSVRRALTLVLAAFRPLSLHELAVGVSMLEGLSSHEDYDLQGDPVAEGEELILKSNPLLMIMPDQTVQLTHSSIREYFLGSKTTPGSSFCFQLGQVHSDMYFVAVSYLSFTCFANLSENQADTKYFFLKYASLDLIHHVIAGNVSEERIELLVSFLNSIQGYRWLRRLHDTYDLDFGDLLYLESQLREWSQPVVLDSEDRAILFEACSYRI